MNFSTRGTTNRKRDISDFITLLFALIGCVAIVFGFIIYWIRPLHREAHEISMRRDSLLMAKFKMAQDLKHHEQLLSDIKSNKDLKLEEELRYMYNLTSPGEIPIIYKNSPKFQILSLPYDEDDIKEFMEKNSTPDSSVEPSSEPVSSPKN